MTQISETYRVDMNGVVDTGRSIMQNIENIANSSYAWSTYDITTGFWSVIINRAGTSTASFTNDNIVGAVDLSQTPLDRLYNAVEIQFPDGTLDDTNRMVRADMLPADLKQNEPENVLRLTYPLINDQIRALTLGLTELKQSRLDKVVSFTTNYTSNGLRAGDIVDITVSTYGWTNKLFRVLEVSEQDTDAGDFALKVICLEYSDTVYTHDTTKFTLSNDDGIFSLGNILAMDPLTVTLTEENQLPLVKVESAFNTAGAPVTGVEIWAYNVTDPTEIANWNNPILYPDDERNYQLVTTKSSIEEAFVLGADFEHDIHDFNAGNWLIKIRPVNALTTGPFTTPGALTTYDPNVAAGLDTDSLVTNLGTLGNIPIQLLNVTNFYTNLATDTTAPTLGGFPTLRALQTTQFICTKSGTYNANFLFEQSRSAATGGRGNLNIGGSQNYPGEVPDHIQIYTQVQELPSTNLVGFASSGGDGAFYWTDFVGSVAVNLVAGTTYRFVVQYLAYTGAGPGVTMDGTLQLTVSLAS